MYVDEEPDFLEQTKLFLERKGERLKVDTALSSQKALDMIEEDDYDVVVSDYPSPGMGGHEFLKTLRDRGNDIPFIIFTGRRRGEVAIDALNIGADRFIQKRGDPRSQYRVLAEAVIREAERWQTERELQRSEERYRTIFENTLDGMIILGEENFEVVDGNQAALRILGFDSLEDVKGEKFLSVCIRTIGRKLEG